MVALSACRRTASPAPARILGSMDAHTDSSHGGVEVRIAGPDDMAAVLAVERDAFGEPDEADLTEALTSGTAYVPGLSLIAEENGRVVGHILFTCAEVGVVRAAVLAPLAVLPDRQGAGIGTALVEAGLEACAAFGFELALVLGHPDYYPRFGFEPAIPHGIESPYPVEPAEAWMALELVPGVFERARGVVRVAGELMDPAMWRE